MTTLLRELSERKDEFFYHLNLAEALELRIFDGESISVGDVSLNVRHVMTMKSGLIVHLYNVVEAVMSRTLDEVGRAVKTAPPSDWGHQTLKEWLRLNASISLDGNEDSRLAVVHKAALQLLQKTPIDRLKFKKPSGTWSDSVIYTFANRLGVRFRLAGDIARQCQKAPKYGDETPMTFLADRRNAIAHGRKTFEDGASDLSLADIKELGVITIGYMELAIDAFQNFVNEKKYMAVEV
jgi:hypothetical protein